MTDGCIIVKERDFQPSMILAVSNKNQQISCYAIYCSAHCSQSRIRSCRYLVTIYHAISTSELVASQPRVKYEITQISHCVLVIRDRNMRQIQDQYDISVQQYFLQYCTVLLSIKTTAGVLLSHSISNYCRFSQSKFNFTENVQIYRMWKCILTIVYFGCIICCPV